jgi:23S rRNA pseudouridine955/2504/2580 synthase/23S rRNA pseudouridine1911/1915/1917 synthase
MNSKFVVHKPHRLVDFLQVTLPQSLSGKALRKALQANGCKVNGRIERFASTPLKKGDLVEFRLNIPLKPTSFDVLYENDDLQLMNKPAGWVCSPENCAKTFGSLRLVHRLDKDTTGVLALAKTKEGYDLLLDAFAERKVKKEYLAIVDGEVKEEMGVIENFLSKKKIFEGQVIWGPSPQGLHALTEWERVQVGNQCSLILCRPITGRTHQIRVHMAGMGHPIITDRQYAASYRSSFTASRPLLHAHRLEIEFKGEHIRVEAPVPSDMLYDFNR